MSEKKVFNVFKNTLGNASFVTSKGKVLHFLNGEHITDVAVDIEELQAEVAAGHPHIYIDKERETVDGNAKSAMDMLKETLRAELLREMEAAKLAASTNNFGETDAKPALQGIANSTTIAEGMSGSTSADVPTASIVQAPPAPAARIIVPGNK